MMDQPGLSEAEHARALAGVRRVNYFSSSVSHLWSALRAMAERRSNQRPLRVLDLACGGGDVPVRLAVKAIRSGIPMEIEGCDMSETALKIAIRTSELTGIKPMRFYSLKALNDPLPQEYDVIMCSLFLHHLANDEALQLMRSMASAARQAILIDDLLRTQWGYALCWVGCRILSRSPIVHVDGPLSVQGAFTVPEVRSLADQAELSGARIKRHWPERFLLSWERS